MYYNLLNLVKVIDHKKEFFMSESCFSIYSYIGYFEELQHNHSERHRIITDYMGVLLRKLSNLDKMARDRNFDFYKNLLLVLEIDSKLQLLHFYLELNPELFYMSDHEIIDTVEEDYKVFYQEISNSESCNNVPYSILYFL